MAPGAQLEQFRILGALGSGGAGDVYRALDASCGREVALKLVRNPSPRQAARLRREGELTARLHNHPGIVTVHGAGEFQGCPYLVYELIPGGRTLAEAWPTLSREQRLRVVREVAEAMGAAHAEGIVHRDLKPANVLLRPDGRAAVADLGLGWSAELDRLTKTGAIAGTPHAMAPEQIAGKSEAYGPATDVWALGVMLFQALTDELPFVGGDLTELLVRISSADAPRVRSLAPDVSPGLDAICARALQRDPARRYADGRAMAEALVRGDEPRARAGKGRVLLLGGVVALGLGLGVLLVSRTGAAPAKEPATPSEDAPAAADHRALEARAQTGDAPAMRDLGELLLRGEAPDVERALSWLERAVEAGELAAAGPLAKALFARGDEHDAVDWLTRAAAGGDSLAVSWLVERLAERGGASVWQEGACARGDAAALLPVALELEPHDPSAGMILIHAAARAGEPEAMQALGLRYRDGLGVEPDEAEAATWYRRGAEAGHGPSMFRFAIELRVGRGVTADEVASVHWFQQAAVVLREQALAGDPEGMNYLGGMYANGFGVELDLDETYRWYQQSAELGNIDGMNRLAVRLGRDGRDAEAITWYRRAIDAGSEAAMCNLGKRLMNGDGVDADPEQAEALFRRAAEAGHPRGMFMLGELFVGRDQPGGVEWIQRAAERGRADAMLRLGELIRDGLSVPGETAEDLLDRAARRRNTQAMVALGDLLREREPSVSESWYRLSAQGGDPQGMLAIARFQLGRDDAVAQGEGLRWAQQAAQRKEVAALRLVGDAYRDGRGVSANREEALRWYRRGADVGDPEAQRALAELAGD